MVVGADLQQGFKVLRDSNQLDKSFEALVTRYPQFSSPKLSKQRLGDSRILITCFDSAIRNNLGEPVPEKLIHWLCAYAITRSFNGKGVCSTDAEKILEDDCLNTTGSRIDGYDHRRIGDDMP